MSLLLSETMQYFSVTLCISSLNVAQCCIYTTLQCWASISFGQPYKFFTNTSYYLHFVIYHFVSGVHNNSNSNHTCREAL